MFGKKKAPTISQERLQKAIRKPTATVRLTRIERARREEAWAPCQITWPLGPVIEGILMDHSETGARVRFRHRGVMPTEIRLICPRLRIDRMASVVRRDTTDIGLHFIS